MLNPILLIVSILLLILIVSAFLNKYTINDELEHFDGMNLGGQTEYTSPIDIYDVFYSKIYDKLFFSNIRVEFEMYNIKQYSFIDQNIFEKSNMSFLDLGCGTGHHLEVLNREQFKCTGIDQSMPMLELARKLNPDTQLIKGNFLNSNIVKPNDYTHILCMFYTIYYVQEPNLLFKNVNMWLQPRGYFCLHLVDKDKFDPVLEASSKLIPLFNPQKHTDKRVTKTKLKFNKFNYISDWDFSKGNNVTLKEKFIFDDNSTYRENIHSFTMYPIQYYIDLAKKNGFQVVKIIDLLPTSHDNNYIYIFQKKFGN